MESPPTPTAGPGIMGYEEYARLRHEVPYVFSVRAGDRRLAYFGAAHSHDPASPQFGEISRAFAEAEPDLVLAEGVSSLASWWEKGAAKLRQRSGEEVARELGEPWFALKLAADARIAADSPEPEFRDEIAYAEAQGASRDALFAYYGYRVVDQYHRVASDAPIDGYLAEHLAPIAGASGWEGYDFSVANLARVGQQFWGDRASLSSADVERIDPVPWGDRQRLWTDVNRAAQLSSRFRDEFMVSRIGEALEKHSSLFVVFGASHAVMQEAAVRAAVESAGHGD